MVAWVLGRGGWGSSLATGPLESSPGSCLTVELGPLDGHTEARGCWVWFPLGDQRSPPGVGWSLGFLTPRRRWVSPMELSGQRCLEFPCTALGAGRSAQLRWLPRPWRECGTCWGPFVPGGLRCDDGGGRVRGLSPAFWSWAGRASSRWETVTHRGSAPAGSPGAKIHIPGRHPPSPNSGKRGSGCRGESP